VVAALAHDALGEDAVACTAKSETLPAAELEDAKRVAREIGIRHEIVSFSELESDAFVENDDDRCYHCRTMRLGEMLETARDLEVETVCDGTNADDPGAGHRPGLQAVEELDVHSPLLAHDIAKDEVREIADRYELSVADKPSMACLSSRIPTGLDVTDDRLARIEQAEALLRQWGSTSSASATTTASPASRSHPTNSSAPLNASSSRRSAKRCRRSASITSRSISTAIERGA